MGKIVQHHQKTKGFLNSLVTAKIPHSLVLTSNTTVLKIPRTNGKTDKYIISNRFLSWENLNFISKVRRSIEATEKPQVPQKRPEYYRYLHKQEGEFKDIVEVDVNGAYWNLAHQKGYLDDATHAEGLTVDKMTRLIALGSIATVRVTHEFLGERYETVGEPDFNPVTRSYFFDIAHDLGEKMKDCILKIGLKNCYFFWVDAFFIPKAYEQEVREFFKGHNMEVKTKDVHKMVTKKTKEGWSCDIYEQKEKNLTQVKPFFFPHGDARKELINKTKLLLNSGEQQNATL